MVLLQLQEAQLFQRNHATCVPVETLQTAAHRMSQPVDDKSSLKGVWSGSRGLYATKLVVSRKWCNIDTLLRQIINRNCYVAYWIVPLPMTLNVIDLLQGFANAGRWKLFEESVISAIPGQLLGTIFRLTYMTSLTLTYSKSGSRVYCLIKLFSD